MPVVVILITPTVVVITLMPTVVAINPRRSPRPHRTLLRAPWLPSSS